MAYIEIEELIRRAKLLTREEQLYLIERLEEGVYDGTHNKTLSESKKVRQPLVGEELVALLESIASLPLESEPDPDLSIKYRDVLYPKQGEMP